MPKRGELTVAIEKTWMHNTGERLNVLRLRLIPYLIYKFQNGKVTDDILTLEEKEIVMGWDSLGLLEYTLGKPIRLTRKGWLVMSEILWLAYVNFGNEEDDAHTGNDEPLLVDIVGKCENCSTGFQLPADRLMTIWSCGECHHSFVLTDSLSAGE